MYSFLSVRVVRESPHVNFLIFSLKIVLFRVLFFFFPNWFRHAAVASSLEGERKHCVLIYMTHICFSWPFQAIVEQLQYFWSACDQLVCFRHERPAFDLWISFNLFAGPFTLPTSNWIPPSFTPTNKQCLCSGSHEVTRMSATISRLGRGSKTLSFSEILSTKVHISAVPCFSSAIHVKMPFSPLLTH